MPNRIARRSSKLSALALILALLIATTAAHPLPHQSASVPQSDLWSATQTILPSDLIKQLAESKGSAKPLVICVGFRPLYAGAHVPGSVFHGAAQFDQGLADLKKFAAALPRSTNLVIYCGCCPLDHCPNLRPAFTALRDMGFTHLRVLLLPHDFATDWVEKGYPTEKGSEKFSNAK
jgi:thiosulfate/3-mercaptopyruvate sulfurtransferase